MNQNIIKIENLSYSYNGKDNIIENLNINIPKGELIAVVGPNGAGKSTLVKIIAGLLEPSKKAKVKVNGKIGYIPQKFNQDVNFPATVKELLNLECCKCNLRDDVTKSLDVKRLENKQFKELSGGQQQRVFIAVSLLSDPEILILDEPTVGIDTRTQEEFYKLLKKLNEERKITILFVTHDTGMISNYFTKVLCIFNKTACLDDAKNTNKVIQDTYGKNFHELNHHHHDHGHNHNKKEHKK